MNALHHHNVIIRGGLADRERGGGSVMSEAVNVCVLGGKTTTSQLLCCDPVHSNNPIELFITEKHFFSTNVRQRVKCVYSQSRHADMWLKQITGTLIFSRQQLQKLKYINKRKSGVREKKNRRWVEEEEPQAASVNNVDKDKWCATVL